MWMRRKKLSFSFFFRKQLLLVRLAINLASSLSSLNANRIFGGISPDSHKFLVSTLGLITKKSIFANLSPALIIQSTSSFGIEQILATISSN
jgi:hypothetical protein